MGVSSLIFGALGRMLASVLLVAMLLLVAAPATNALLTTVSSLWRWPEVRSSLERVSGSVEEVASAAEVRFKGLRELPAGEIEDRLKEIELELAGVLSASRLPSTSYLDLAQALAQGQLEEMLKGEVKRRIIVQERDALRHLHAYAVGVGGRRAMQQHEVRTRQRHREAKQLETDAESEVRRLEAQVWCKVPGTSCSSALDKARRVWFFANAEAWRAYREWETAKAAADSVLPGAPPLLRVDRASVSVVFDDMSRAVARVASWQVTAAQPIRDALVNAVQIVAAGIALIIGMKAFFFYFLAPLAERRPPVVVRDGKKRATFGSAAMSALSLQVAVSSEQELLAAGSHLQSVADSASTRTKWLLSLAHPFTSLFSGLWMLTRVRATRPVTVVLSATTDPLEELNTVSLVEGETLVLLPKHLVGVILPVGRDVRLQGQWRAGVHAWLTLQFRYLVFEGPCTLIVAGCRGVRVEATDNGRAVSQTMLVGFSSYLEYSVARTETFTAYLLGQRPLFHDHFHGPGVVIYQEVPSSAQRSGFTGRGIQGLADGAMKAFGM